MKSILAILLSFGLVVSGFSQTRNVVVDTNGVIVQPTNIWTANATNARSGLGLGTAATNPASAFQPSSSVLSNLASSNGVNITNLRSTNIVGIIPSNNISMTSVSDALSILNGGTGATNAATARTNLGLGANDAVTFLTVQTEELYSGTNAIVSLINQELYDASSGGVPIASWGSAEFNFEIPLNFVSASKSTTRTNLGLGWPALTNSNSANVLLGYNSSNGRVVANVGTNVLYFTNERIAFTTGDLQISNNIFTFGGDIRYDVEENSFAIGIGFLSTAAANDTRTNLGLGWSALTNFNSANTLLGYDAANGHVVYASTNALTFTNTIQADALNVGYTNLRGSFIAEDEGLVISVYRTNTQTIIGNLGFTNNSIHLALPVQFSDASNSATTRTNLGLGWSALTNSNTGTGLVSVDTNGEVVSPTNFWQVSPANTRVQLVQPVINSTNTATNARNLYLYSLAISTTGVTNTIQLPTNGGTLLGDVATLIHEGPTSSVTAVRQTGEATNLITLNQFQEAVKFIYETGGWRLADNLSFVEPIYFSGTNATVNADESRTNLRIPLSALTNTNNATFQEAIFTTNAAPTNSANVNTVNFNTAVAWMEVSIVTNSVTNSYRIPLFK